MEILLNEFSLLCKNVLTQLKIVEKLLEDNSVESLYKEMEANEIIIDRLEVKIREEVVFSIFKFNPVAQDLRLIMAYQEMTTNLERIGDLALNIGHRLKNEYLKSEDTKVMKGDLMKMNGIVHEMTRDAISAFQAQDVELAYKVIEKDNEVDNLFEKNELTLVDKYDNRSVDKDTVSLIIDIASISYNLERIGDSATNIAESAVYIAQGKDIRHEQSRQD